MPSLESLALLRLMKMKDVDVSGLPRRMQLLVQLDFKALNEHDANIGRGAALL